MSSVYVLYSWRDASYYEEFRRLKVSSKFGHHPLLIVNLYDDTQVHIKHLSSSSYLSIHIIDIDFLTPDPQNTFRIFKIYVPNIYKLSPLVTLFESGEPFGTIFKCFNVEMMCFAILDKFISQTVYFKSILTEYYF